METQTVTTEEKALEQMILRSAPVMPRTGLNGKATEEEIKRAVERNFCPTGRLVNEWNATALHHNKFLYTLFSVAGLMGRPTPSSVPSP